MVPCKDGSFIGGIVSCRGTRDENQYGWCKRPVLTRSWDGGKSWTPENVDIPDHSPSGVVRLRNGDLLTSHGRWEDRFLRSTDNGHSWFAEFDSALAPPVLGGPQATFDLVRDFRGMLFWRSGGALFMSIDEGKHFVWVSGSSARQGFYVLFPNGMLVTYLFGSYSFRNGNIDISYDHGRSWIESLYGYERNDSSLIVDRSGVIRDTLVVGVRKFGRNALTPVLLQTWNHQEQTKSWKPGVSLGSGFTKEILLDSTESVWGYTSASISRKRSSDSHEVVTYQTVYTDSLPPDGDTSVAYSFEYVYGFFYDLDGNIHPHGMNFIFPTDKPRPISRLDRLYTCNGVQYVVGGRSIMAASLNTATSRNARLSYVVTPNRRMVTIDVVAKDTTLPMYVEMRVDDQLLGKQWFYDSVDVGIPVPKIELYVRTITYELTLTDLRCNWAHGPFMWYKDGEPYKQPNGYGYAGDASIEQIKPGKYKVRGRTKYGCVVESNEIEFTTTDVANSTAPNPEYRIWYSGDKEIRVDWDQNTSAPGSITVADVLGRAIETTVHSAEGQARIKLESNAHLVFVSVVNGTSRSTLGIVVAR